MSLDTATATVKLRSLTAKFDNGVKSATPFYPQLCTEVPSDGYDEEYGLLGRVPQVREWIGDRDFKQLRAARFTIVNKPWESSLSISKDDIADDRLSLYGPTLEQMGIRAAHHPDKLLFSLINNGETGDCFDGQDFFDTDHAWGDSGSQSNDLSASAVSPTAPTATEFKTAYNAALVAMMGFKDDQGELVNAYIFDEVQGILVVVPPTFLQVAHEALTVKLGSQGGDNVVIARPRIVSSALYTGTTKFDIYKTDEPIKPYIWQPREPLGRQMKGLDDMEFKDVKFMSQARYNLGYGAWWCAVRSTFA